MKMQKENRIIEYQSITTSRLGLKFIKFVLFPLLHFLTLQLLTNQSTPTHTHKRGNILFKKIVTVMNKLINTTSSLNAVKWIDKVI